MVFGLYHFTKHIYIYDISSLRVKYGSWPVPFHETYIYIYDISSLRVKYGSWPVPFHETYGKC